MTEFGKYLVYVDEAGDHVFNVNNTEFPVFVLAFCIFEKEYYCNYVLPKFNELKLQYFKDLNVIFHEREIRKHLNQFAFLTEKNIRESFFNDLNSFMKDLDFTIIATVINKKRLQQKYKNPYNPYELATKYCLERLKEFLIQSESLKPTSITFESRGKKEDDSLKIAFLEEVNSIVYGGNLDIAIIDKKSNQAGLQIADLVARPIGRHVMDSEQVNQAFDILKGKFRKNEHGKYNDCGLKVFP